MAIDVEKLPAARGIYRIYCDRVSYVGLSDNIRERIRQHLEATSGRSRILLDTGRARVKVLELLPKASDAQLAAREWHWYERLRQRGQILVNDPQRLGVTASGQHFPQASETAGRRRSRWQWAAICAGVGASCFAVGFGTVSQWQPARMATDLARPESVFEEGALGSPVPDASSRRAFDCRQDDLLGPGEEGSQVTALQSRLRTLGYYRGRPDGIYGDGTVAAVEAFQRDRNLLVDGVAGCRTQQALSEAT